MKTVIVIPHHLPTLDFLEEWKQEFDNPDTHIIIVNDRLENKLGVFPNWNNASTITIYNHTAIDQDLGKNSWIIPRGTSAIRSYGLWKAWQMKPDMIVTLDNDCFYDYPNYVEDHWNALNTPATLDWVTSVPDEFMENIEETRGFPYKIRNKAQVALNHGLWSNIPDLDAAQMLQYPDLRTYPVYKSMVIPRYNFTPVCGMNLAWRPEVTPLMYFGLHGKDYEVDQFDDIWMGILCKKIIDHLGYAMRSGYPSVEHRKQSDAFTNFRKQAGGLEMNEYFWQAVKDVQLTKDTVIDCYKELITKLPDTMQAEPQVGYMKKFKKASLIWADLFTV